MSDDAEYDKYLEDRARSLGLPTDPEAYQDSGVGVAATARTTAEAELIAAQLNARDIPAWADQPYASTMLSHAQFAINPDGVRVLVPLGRLADARRVVAGHGDQEETPDDAVEPTPARALWRTVAAILVLGGGLWLVVVTILLAFSAAARGVGRRPEPVEVLALIVMGYLGLAATIVGILGLRTKPRPED